ncbi:MAG: GntR family transcriptional regulator [bacterium]
MGKRQQNRRSEILQGKVPNYFLIESLIRHKILNGQLEPGERLPPEIALASEFSVNRITVRSAMTNLKSEKLITRGRGKGTFVARHIPVSKQVIVTSGERTFVASTKQYKIKALGIETRRVNQSRIARELREFFAISNDHSISIVRRLRAAQRTPVMLTENHILPETAGKLDVNDLHGKPFLEIAKSKMGVTIGRTEGYLEAVAADPDIAESLHYPMFAPLFLIWVYVWLPNGEPFEISTTYMRTDYFKFKIVTEHDGDG